MKKYNTAAVILAAGSGSRMKLNTTKQRLSILGRSVLSRTLEAFERCEDIDSIVVVTREDELDFVKTEIKPFTKVSRVVIGGKTRAESAGAGFLGIPENTDFVAIHDAARCLITPEMISRVIADSILHGAATASSKITDTVKKIDAKGFVTETANRDFVMLASTPQIFKTEIYAKALQGVDLSSAEITDDNMLVERAGFKVYCTDTGKENIKITYQSDVAYAEFILKGREQ